MTLRARRRLRTTLFALCTLLLAQWTLASHACPAVSALLDAAATAQALAEDGAEPCHCEDDAVCAKHCFADEYAGGNPAPAAMPPAAAPALRVAQPDATAPSRAPCSAPEGGDATAPPLTILYCVSLT